MLRLLIIKVYRAIMHDLYFTCFYSLPRSHLIKGERIHKLIRFIRVVSTNLCSAFPTIFIELEALLFQWAQKIQSSSSARRASTSGSSSVLVLQKLLSVNSFCRGSGSFSSTFSILRPGLESSFFSLSSSSSKPSS